MRRLIREDEWKPVGVDELEPAAESVVRSSVNTLVVAGPGAGKTEILAQRANFLLETGLCPAPDRILAISFKRDAAKNLAARVSQRCLENRASRFESMTLDAFAKSLVDRFRRAIPPSWRPAQKYEVRTRSINPEEARAWLRSAIVPPGVQAVNVEPWDRQTLSRCLDLVMHGNEMPFDIASSEPLLAAWSMQWWQEAIKATEEGRPSITFPMLNRMAAFLLRQNPTILSALRLTYSHVFLDEFQDTTASQWDLIRSAFAGSRAVVTAVGDGKQRIMVWAGAKTDIFERYVDEFGASRRELVRNYRSAAGLVKMQHVIAKALEDGVLEAVPASSSDKSGICVIHEYRDARQEAVDLAELIASEVEAGANARDFCILSRQRVPEMTELLRDELASRGIPLRDESALQDLLAEPVCKIVISSLTLATQPRAPEAWTDLMDQIRRLTGLDGEDDSSELERLAAKHREVVSEVIEQGRISDVPHRVVAALGEDRYLATYRQYSNGYLEEVLKAIGAALQSSLDATKAPALVRDHFLGVVTVPAMTIHKSKGLEFRTVVFVGLEDGQWWSFGSQPEEEKRAFFVAFSRASERVIFTACDRRDTGKGTVTQRRVVVGSLYEILGRAGVASIDRRVGDVS